MDLTRAWRIEDASGTDRTARLAPYFRRLTVSDRPGRQADEATILLANDPAVEVPEVSKALKIWMGESSEALVDLGTHYVTDFGLTGAPEELEITARPVYFGGGDDPDSIEAPARAQEALSIVYPSSTFGSIAQQIADRLGVNLAIDAKFSPFVFEAVVQERESDPSFVTRLAKLAGGIAKLAPGVLVVGTPHTAKSYGRGQNMPTVELAKTDVSTYNFRWSARKAPGTVVAYWHTVKTGQKGSTSAGEAPPVTALRKTFGSQTSAERAAQAHLDALKRGKRPGSFTLNRLNLALWVGSTVDLGNEWHPNVRGSWEVTEATHELDSTGGATTINIERDVDNG